MITHVAEVAEARGRVVLRVTQGTCADRVVLAAVDAAVRLAQAFRAEIECLYIEDIELLQLASYSFAVEIPALGTRLGHGFGGGRRALSVVDVERDMRLQFSGLQRLIEQRASLADVPVRLRVLRDDLVAAVASTCADCGPWNVVVLAEPLASLAATDLASLFAGVPDATGFVIEHADALPAMLHTAERLVEGSETAIVILLFDSDPDTGPDLGPDLGQKLDTQVRLALSDRPPINRANGMPVNVQLVTMPNTHGDPAAIAEALRRLCPGFLIARFGGQIVPPSSSLRPLGAILRFPLLLIR
jgi:hypothetical protein